MLTNLFLILKEKLKIIIFIFFLMIPLSLTFGQTRQITGIVIDSRDGSSLPGVSVVIKGTTVGTVTDADGKYSLLIPPDAVIQFSFIGYVTQEVIAGDRKVIDVVLSEDVSQLEEVVVVGYGTQTKKSIVAAITQAAGDDIKRASSGSDLTTALASQLPGIISLTSSGEPGGIITGESTSATNIFIRGQNTWNAAGPLILVDGIDRSMNNINVNEVESISILKDASATAVYGVKGANGVILINTKRGMDGKTKLTFNYTATGQMLSKLPKTLDSYDAMMAKNEMIEREVSIREGSWSDYVPYEVVERYRKPQSEMDAYIFPNLNWEEEMFKKMGFLHKVNVTAQGGNKFITYFGSLGYLHEGDMFRTLDNGKGYDPSFGFDRFNFRSNLDFKLTNTTTIKANLSGFFSQKNTNYANSGSSSQQDGWMWGAVYSMAPNLYPAQYPDGTWGTGVGDPTNPAAVANNLGVRKRRTTSMQSDFKLEQDLSFITKGLSAAANLSFDNSIQSEGGIYDANNHVRAGEEGANVAYTLIYPMQYVLYPDDPSKWLVRLPVSAGDYDWYIRPWGIRTETTTTGNNDNWLSYLPIQRRLSYQFQLNYNRKFGDHNVGGTGVFKREEYSRGAEFKSYREDWIFRVTYDYDSRYLLELNGAYNGSEKFGPGYRFDFFPSIGVGWYFSNEKFFTADWVDRLKVRYSIGKVGDDRAGGRYLYEQMYAYGGQTRMYWNTGTTSAYTFYRISNMANPYAKWEQATKSNLGVEFGAMKNLVSVAFDYFTEDRKDMLIAGNARSIPPYFGFTPPPANIGRVTSKGFEFELGLNKSFRDLLLSAKFSITHATNKVMDRDDPKLYEAYMKQAGYPLNQNKRLLNTGYFYNNWDEVWASVPTETNDLQKLPGYYDLIDYDGNGIINSGFDSAPVEYSEVPQNTGSLTLRADYKGFNFIIQFYGVNNANRWIPWTHYMFNKDLVWDHAADYWSKDNPNASSFLPRWRSQAQNIGHYYLYDASYIRLQNMEFGYSFANNLVKKIGLTQLRIFLNCNNVFFWSKLPDDRESTNSRNSATGGSYPNLRRFNLGIDISF